MNYEYFTTFWGDLSIAEMFGAPSIKDSAKQMYEEWKDDVKYLTELVMILNHKCWHYHDLGMDAMSELYSDLYYEYYDKAINYLEEQGNEDDIKYFIRTLD